MTALLGGVSGFDESQDEDGGVDEGCAAFGPGPVDDVGSVAHEDVVRGEVGVQEGVADEEGGGSGRGVGGPALFGGFDGDAGGGGDLLEFRNGCGDAGQVGGARGVVGVSSRKDFVAEEVPAGRLEVPMQAGAGTGEVRVDRGLATLAWLVSAGRSWKWRRTMDTAWFLDESDGLPRPADGRGSAPQWNPGL